MSESSSLPVRREPDAQQLMRRIMDGDESPAELARSAGMSLMDLLDWAEEPTARRAIDALARLENVRTQMLINRFRATAAVKLLEIASAEANTDLSRKACVDLLKADLGVVTLRDASDARDPAPAAPDEETILRTLEALGRDAEDDGPGSEAPS